MAATIVKRELCTSSQWPKSFSMNDTQIQWEFRHKMLKDRWRKSKSSKTCLPPTPTSQINQRRKNDVHTEGSFIMATQKFNNFPYFQARFEDNLSKKSEWISRELEKLSARVQELEELGEIASVQQYTYVSIRKIELLGNYIAGPNPIYDFIL